MLNSRNSLQGSTPYIGHDYGPSLLWNIPTRIFSKKYGCEISNTYIKVKSYRINVPKKATIPPQLAVLCSLLRTPVNIRLISRIFRTINCYLMLADMLNRIGTSRLCRDLGEKINMIMSAS